MSVSGDARRANWGVICAFGAASAANQVLWLTYAAITTESARHYGVSTSTIGWLAEIFPLLYVVLAIPAGILLDRWFRSTLATAAVLMAAGGLVRVAGESSFLAAIAGQALVAIAQPLLLSGVARLAGEYLPESSRASGIAVGSGANFLGMVLALGLGPTIGAHGHVARLLDVDALLTILPVLWLLWELRRHGAWRAEETVAIEGSAARALWRVGEIRTLSGLVFVGFGIFVAIATWLQQLLKPAGVSETQAGLLLVGMVVAGIIGSAAIPPPVARRHAERSYMGLAAIVACASCVLIGAVSALGVQAGALAVMGLVLLPALPVILTRAEVLAGPAAGSAGALIWMAGNLGGLVVALIVQGLVHHSLAAFLVMGAVGLVALPLSRRLPGALPGQGPNSLGMETAAGNEISPPAAQPANPAA